jgi:TonB family protein
VRWSTPSSDGGSAITSYRAVSSPGAFSCTTTTNACVVAGLTNGVVYTFTVTATNAVGTSPVSATSNEVTPVGVGIPAVAAQSWGLARLASSITSGKSAAVDSHSHGSPQASDILISRAVGEVFLGIADKQPMLSRIFEHIELFTNPSIVSRGIAPVKSQIIESAHPASVQGGTFIHTIFFPGASKLTVKFDKRSGKGSGNGNRKLDGRKLSSKDKHQRQKCNESGTVVVQIKVNRNGNVIAAKYSKGTDNTSQCLLEPAYETAKSYKWEPDPNAPETQIGYITINFKLGQ